MQWSILAASLALAACGGAGDDATATSSPAPSPAPSPTPAPSPAPAPAPAPAPGPGSLSPLPGTADAFPQPPAPLAATPVTGPGQNRSVLSWDPAGTYRLGLTHANGVQSQLLVPAGTFLSDVFLTVTEVADVGPAVTAVVAAVRVDPGDLLGEVPLMASFNLPDALLATIDRSQLVGFIADADGSNLHLVPIVPGPDGALVAKPAVSLNHLGMAGIALATPAQQAALAAAWPADPTDQLAAAVAPAGTAQWRATAQPTSVAASASTLRAHALQAGDPENPLLAPLRGYFNDTVVPAFAAAYGDPAQIPAAIQAGFAFLRQTTLLGLAEPGGPLQAVADDLQARIDALLDVYADYVAQQCTGVGDPAALQLTLGTIRQLQLLGHGAKAAELENVLPQCSRFTVSFSQDFKRTGQWNSGGTQFNEDLHTVIEGTTTFGLNEAVQIAQLHLKSVTNNTTSGYNGMTGHVVWVPNGSTSPWGAFNLSVPTVRTRSGTPPSSLELTLHAYGSIPLTVTETAYRPDGSSQVNENVPVSVPLDVPALPPETADNYGPVLIPRSGSVTSQGTRERARPNGSVTEQQTVTITLRRAE